VQWAAGGQISRQLRRIGIQPLLDRGDAGIGIGMGGENIGPAAAAAAGLFENFHDAEHLPRVIAGFGHVAQAEVVGLELVGCGCISIASSD
jgi:hypothetical protein